MEEKIVKPDRGIKKKITRRWLTAVDIARAANSLYGWGHSIGFEVVGSPEQFKSTLLGSGGDPGLLQRLRSGEINNAVLIINQENRHWVSVVINRDQGGNLRAYWADSLGQSDVGFYTSFTQHLLRNGVSHVHDLSVLERFPAQEDGYSCGAHALINAREIVRQFETNPGVSSSNIADALRGVERSELVRSIYREAYRGFLGQLRNSNIPDLTVEYDYKSLPVYRDYGPQIQIMTEILKLLTPHRYNYDPLYEPAENFLENFEWHNIKLDYFEGNSIAQDKEDFFSSLLLPLTYGQEKYFATRYLTCILPYEFIEGAQEFVEREFGSESEENFIVSAILAYDSNDCKMEMKGRMIHKFASKIIDNLRNLIGLEEAAVTVTELRGLVPTLVRAQSPPEHLDNSQNSRVALCLARILFSSIYNLRYHDEYSDFALRLGDEFEEIKPVLLTIYHSGNNEDVGGFFEVLKRLDVERGLMMYQEGKTADARRVWEGVMYHSGNDEGVMSRILDEIQTNWEESSEDIENQALAHFWAAIALYSAGDDVSRLKTLLLPCNFEVQGTFAYLILKHEIAQQEHNPSVLLKALLEVDQFIGETFEERIYSEMLLKCAKLLKTAGDDRYKGVARRVIDNAISTADVLDACQLVGIDIGYVRGLRQALKADSNSLQGMAFDKAYSSFMRDIRVQLELLPQAFDPESAESSTDEDADSASSAAVAGEDQNIEEEGELEEEQQPVNRVENRKRPREDDPDSPQPGPSCSRRSRFKRGAGAICIDSTEEDELTEEQQNKINEALESDFGKKHLARVSLYEKLHQIAGVVTGEQELTQELEEDVKASIRDMSPEDLKAIEPGMKPIILRLKSKIESGKDIKPVFKEAGVARKISSAAEGAGAVFTVFLVGKHLLNGDVKGLGYDALNLYVMPKIGQKIAEHVGKLGAKLESTALKSAAPVLGRAVGNFAAFLGLYQSIKARQSATDPVDKQIADLNIATNSIFIAADMPAVAAEIGVEAGIEFFAAAASFAGPIGSAVGVATIIIAQFVDAGLEVEKISEHISLTAAEKNTLYWHFFDGGLLTGGSAFAKIEKDIELKEIYTRYIENIARDYDHYKNVVISLPQVVRENHYDRLYYPESLRVSYANNTYRFPNMRLLPQKTTHSLGKKSLVSSNNNTLVESRLLPNAMLNGTFLCGLSGVESAVDVWANSTSVTEDIMNEYESWTQLSREIYIGPEDARYVPAICKNSNTESAGSFCYLDSDKAVIESPLPNAHVVFTGQSITFGQLENAESNGTNRFYFNAELDHCSIHTGGINFFYINSTTLNCDFASGAKNFVVHRGNFTDSSGIDTLIGSSGSNHFLVSHAKYVDGMGGDDVIDAKNFTIIQSYPGDTVLGKGIVLLPFNLTEISVITYNNSTYVIKSNSWSPISVDGSTQEYKPYHLYNAYGEVTVGVNSTMKTRDGFFITPMRHENGAVTDLQVSQLVLHRDNDTISNFAQTLLDRSRSAFFNLSRHFQSDMTDYIIADKGRHVFYPEKNGLHYWQAGNSTPNLYLTECGRMGSVLVSKANGVLDLSCADADLNIHHLYDNTIYFYIGKKAVAALVNGIGDLKIKFPGERYYDFYSSILDEYCELHVPFTRIGEDRFVVTNVSDAVWMGLNRDYCSHNLEISGRQVTDANHLSGHYNCFSFDSDKVIFLRLRDSLLLVSGASQLFIENYYSVLHQNWDISIKTPSNLIKPTEFADLASNAHTYKYYKPLEEQKTRIFHNQPLNRNQIGFVDLSDRPITDFKFKDHHVLHRSGKVTKNDLKINCNREKIATIKNWNTSPEVRKMIFAFSDAILFNCIFNCTKEAIYRELREKKLAALEELQSNVTTTQLPSESTTAPTQTREKRDVNNEEHLPLSSSATRSTSFLGNAIGVLKNALFMSSNWFLGKETQASRITKSFIRCSDVHFVTHPSSKMHSANSPIALISPSDQTKGRDIGPAVISAAAANTLLAHCMASAFNWRMTQHERTQQVVQFAKDTEIPVKEATDGIKRSVRKLCYGYGDKELASINSLFTEHFSKIKDDLRESVKIEGGHGLTSCAKLHKENFKSALSSYSSKCAVERIGGIPTWLFAEKIESATSQGLGC